MSAPFPKARLLAGAAMLVAAGVAGGLGIARLAPGTPPPAPTASERKVLYWYDPMVPGQHFDKPGKSPFMDMQLVPRYADEAEGAGVRIDPSRVQSLGVRTAKVERGSLASESVFPGVLEFNEREVSVVQPRVGGIVQRVYARAPGDVVAAGAPLADLLVPEWGGPQAEFLAVRRTGDAALTQAARQRLTVVGMPAATIEAVERTGRTQTTLSVSTPTSGVIRSLGVRAGMTVAQGQTLAEVNGLGTVWFIAAIPEALAGQVRQGQSVNVTFTALPGETFSGRLSAILPEATAESRTLSGRVELANRGGRLRPGMYGQAAFSSAASQALLIPSEAVIRTGRRTLVMLAEPGGRYRAAEVRIGRESGARTEVLAGLSEGETVVASGQFLIDSEASLSGVQARPVTSPAPARAATPTTFQSRGRIEAVKAGSVTLSHEPVPALQWPAMTMDFTVGDPKLTAGLRVGDRVDFTFEQVQGNPPTVRGMTKAAP